VIVIPALGPLNDDVIPPVLPRPRGDTTGLKRVKLDGVRPYLNALMLPVPAPRLTSTFGWRDGRFHEGLDLAAAEGTKIRAAHDGQVVFVHRNYGGYGKIIVIKGDNLLTIYGHNSRNRVDVGDTISRGDWIGDVGQTGSASGSHVHFETRVRDEKGHYAAVDPLLFFSREQRS